MVAPLVLAGIGVAVGAIGRAILGKAELFAVVWMRHRQRHAGESHGVHAVRTLRPDQLHPGGQPIHPHDGDEMVSEIVGRTYTNLKDAEAFQQILATKHYKCSIIVHQSKDGELDCLNPIKAMAPPKKKPAAHFVPGRAGHAMVHPGMRVEGMGDTPANPGATSVTSNPNATAYHSFMDKRAVAMDNLDVTTGQPVPHWAIRSRFGPYFEPDQLAWKDSPSSHMWDIQMETRTLPFKYGQTYFRGEGHEDFTRKRKQNA